MKNIQKVIFLFIFIFGLFISETGISISGINFRGFRVHSKSNIRKGLKTKNLRAKKRKICKKKHQKNRKPAFRTKRKKRNKKWQARSKFKPNFNPYSGEADKGICTYYHPKFHGHKTASGEKYHRHKLTAAHRTLPFGTNVKITNMGNGKTVVVKVNDRGPFSPNYLIDVSEIAAKQLGFYKVAPARVQIQVLGVKDSSITPNSEFDVNPVQEITSKPEIKLAKTEATIPPFFAFKKPIPGQVYTSRRLLKSRPKGFTFQLYSFSDMEGVNSACDSLLQQNLSDFYLLPVWVKGKVRYKLLYGLFGGKKQAEPTRQIFIRKGLKPVLLKFSSI